MAWSTVHCQYAAAASLGAVACVPAGSFKWDRLVRSSLASSMAGFISGGRFSSLPVWMADSVVSTDFFCECIVSCALSRGQSRSVGVPRRSRAGTPASPCRPRSSCRRPRRRSSRRSGRAAMPGCRSRRCVPCWRSCPAPSGAVVGVTVRVQNSLRAVFRRAPARYSGAAAGRGRVPRALTGISAWPGGLCVC
jgi:hypothetical protein